MKPVFWTLVGIVALGVVAMMAVSIWGPILEWGFGSGNSVKAEFVAAFDGLNNSSTPDDIQTAIRDAVSDKLITHDQAISLQAAIDRALIKGRASIDQIKDTVDDAAFDGLTFEELVADIRDLKAPKVGTTPTAPAVSGGTTQQPATPSGTGVTGSYKTGCDGKDVGAVQALIGLNVVCLGTEYDAYTWRSVPIAVDAICPSGWVCTLHLKDGDRVVVVEGNGTKYNIVAGTFRRKSGYPSGDGVHNACELLRKEQVFGASQTPKFDVSAQGFTCNGTTVTSSSSASTATQAMTQQQGASQPPASNSTGQTKDKIDTKEEAASAAGGDVSNWTALDGSNNTGFKFKANKAISLKVPDGARIDHAQGSANPGQSVTASEATLWILN